MLVAGKQLEDIGNQLIERIHDWELFHQKKKKGNIQKIH